MTDARFARLVGRMRAIELALSIVITAHPQDRALRMTLRQELDSARDQGLFSDLPETVFEGWDETVRHLGL